MSQTIQWSGAKSRVLDEESRVRHAVANIPRALLLPIASPELLHPTDCASCDGGEADGLIYGDDPDGFVLCRACRSPLFYCDLGGEG